MKIALVCNSDMRGGAAVVTHRLMCAFRNIGIDASMLVINKSTDDQNVYVIGTQAGHRIRFLSERAYIFTHNGFNRTDLFKVSIANTGYDITKHRLIADADAVILSWINQGMMSMIDITRLATTGKRVLWVMHDMWCMTGACHHALDCDGYKNKCGHCPYIKGGRIEDDLSRKGWERKKRLYENSPGLTMVAVSNWLAKCAHSSTLLKNHDIRVIHNAFPDDIFHISPLSGIDIPTGIDRTKTLIVMGAARLDDPIKGLPTAIEALNLLARQHPDIASHCQAVFYGDLREPAALDNLAFPHIHTGRISEQATLRELFSMATVVLSTSKFETLPGTVIEGMAAGCTPVTTGNGGQRDIVTDGKTGYITGQDPADIARALVQALTAPFDRASQHRTIASRFGAESIARQFLHAIKRMPASDVIRD